MAQVIVERACAKLRSAIGDEAVARSNFTGDLRDMLEALEHVQPILDRAEMHLRRDFFPSRWLQRALGAAYKTIDMVDELQDSRPQAAATMTRRMLPRLAIMKNAMAIQVQETKKLVMWLQEQSGSLSKYLPEKSILLEKIIKERKTGPGFEEALVLGRGSDKQRIIAALPSTEPNIMQEHITILPIFGLVGSGKTTLAQMVFNDTHSLQGYDFRVWVHVSPQFDFHAIGKSIISQVSARGQEETNHSSSDMEGMQSIMKRLHELLNGKKVLLVLDDLWEEDPIRLQLLKSMLTFLGDRMDVIVTTCNQAIARKICTIEPYRLNPLSDEACWEIIKKLIRFEGGEEELEKIGREIASKCWGVPSAARAYAGILGSSRDAMTWKNKMKEDILFYALPAFKLSYMRMPPELRLCFAYCCQIFPSGHIIVKDDLVHHWIALHLIEPSEILSAAQIAEEHITRLQDMSFLQTAQLNHVSNCLLLCCTKFTEF
ncbi:putative disease resistance protein RGA1 [Hordeum vulgare subsp. vulgare]|uniref:putative disease resistance protein RGA1 n=1 Tax=Hordeum vulgare subsp. vulgare TaxID=112509 RepID=UPI001D1A445D|nr:putative disease resistance protein RGA1 [Hordeum vulgare subsp. vulgare]